MSTTRTQTLPSGRRSSARVITEILSPAHLVVGLLLLIGAASTPSPIVGAAWGLLAAVFAGLLPYGFLLYGVRRGRYSDRHVRVREQRTVPLLFGAGCIVAGLAVLGVLGAPRQLLALVVAMLAGLAVTLAITLVWKVSVHTAVASGVAVILTLVFGPFTALVTWPAVAAVAWSRVQLRDHTLAQVVVGTVMGAIIAAGLFSALR